MSPTHLAEVIIKIVAIESPIHISEVIKRVRIFWGLKKTGKKIRKNINMAWLIAQQQRKISIKDDFLYYNGKQVKVRRRTPESKPNIDLISQEEIEKAIITILETQYATAPDDLITKTARIFGFKSTRKKTSNRIREVLNNQIQNNELIEMTNGMINVPK